MALLINAVLIVVGIAIGWAGNGWRLNLAMEEMVTTHQKELIDQQGEAIAKRDALAKQLKDANYEAGERERILRRTAADAGNATNKLRNEIASIRSGLPTGTANACIVRADALANLFGQCVERYRGVAESATRITNDRQALIDGGVWAK